TPTPGQPDHAARAADAVEVLQRWYSRRTGLWRSTGWWNAANALIAVTGYMRATGDRAYLDVIANTFRAAGRKHPGFVNEYFDDNGWWGLAWVAAHDLTGHDQYLTAAQAVFRHNLAGWDGTCGGTWWNTSRRYKNAVTNELFLLLAGLLAQRAGGQGTGGAAAGREYRDWALRAWDWLDGSGMINPAGLINDGLTAGCVNNGGTTWTYNQGVILGGLLTLSELTGEDGYRRRAQQIADAALRTLTSPDGILTEPSEPAGTDGDQTQFKGIFVRYLGQLQQAGASPAYRDFLLANADSAWARARNEAGQFGVRWAGPFDKADASRQSSALELLTAAALAAGH
ncbi:MAG TPA: glycoside hydrolase family 76 protein, partial [Trebonia sp.]|nr:glycoside hydrolase family 76 protein [Trebonia sp.]